MDTNGNGSTAVGRIQDFFGLGKNPMPTSPQLGYTAPASPEPPAPRVNAAMFGQSGRANYWGLPQWDETNALLIGPAGQLLFDQMYRMDPDIRHLVLMISSPVQSASWTLEPYGGDDATEQDRDIADAIWWGLNSFMKPNFRQHLAEALPLLIRAGFAPFEQVWSTTEYKGKTLMFPRSLQVRLPRSIWRWWQDEYGQMTHIGQIIPNNPTVIIPASELTYYRLGAEGDNWMGTSLLRSAYKPWVIKDKLERIDAIGQERKAVGVPICYPPANADEQTRMQVESILANMHLNEVSYLMSPGPKQGLQGMSPGEGWLFEVITFDSSSGDSIQASLAYHQQGILYTFLGEFMSLGHHQVGARATADVQEDPFLTAVQAFAQVGPLPPLNELVDRITKVNYPDADGSPTFSINLQDEASLSEIATYVQLLESAGVINVDPELEDWVRERGGLPPANSDVRALVQAAKNAALKSSALQAQGSQVNPVSQTPPSSAPQAPGGPVNTQQGTEPQGNLTKTAPPAERKKLDTPSAKWYEDLLSQDKLKTALDGARQSVEDSAREPALLAARQLASQAASNRPAPVDKTPLADAIHTSYRDLYQVGQQTATDELAKQRQLMSPTLEAAGARVGRAASRALLSAGNVVHAVQAKLGSAATTGLLDGAALQDIAEQAAIGQLHLEAMLNASASINDGRYDAAAAHGAVGGYYTSVLDGNTCDNCEAADTGDLLTLDDAAALGPPNPDCDGGDRCRCMIVFTTGDDPTAS